MRISTNQDDRGYTAWQNIQSRGDCLKVYLDGHEQQGVVTADDEAGLVVRHVLNSDGQAQINPENTNEVWTEEVRGQVTFEQAE